MTTAQQVKRLAAPLLSRRDDLALVDRMIVVKPVRHLLRFIYVDRTGEADRFRPCWALMGLFSKYDDAGLGGGEQLYPSFGLWRWSLPGVADEFATVVERDALPKMRAIDTLEAYAEHILRPENYRPAHFRSARFQFNLVLGRLDEAREFIREANDSIVVKALDDVEPGISDRILAEGSRLSHVDRAALARIFRERGAHTVRKLKIEHLWEPAPFPLEINDPSQDIRR